MVSKINDREVMTSFDGGEGDNEKSHWIKGIVSMRKKDSQLKSYTQLTVTL